MTSKLSVNMAYFCTNFVIIMQLSYVLSYIFASILPKNFENVHSFLGKEVFQRSS